MIRNGHLLETKVHKKSYFSKFHWSQLLLSNANLRIVDCCRWYASVRVGGRMVRWVVGWVGKKGKKGREGRGGKGGRERERKGVKERKGGSLV